MSDWIYPKKPITILEFSYEGLLKPGMLIEIREHQGKRQTTNKKQLLVGHVNNLLGVCDDCTIDTHADLIRYKVVWTP